MCVCVCVCYHEYVFFVVEITKPVNHYCSESLAIKFRTDGSGGATGYRIKVSKLNDCTKAMSKNEPFDVFAVPSIAHCPPLTLKYIKDAYAKTLAYVSGDPGHGETKTPIQQCVSVFIGV